MRQQRLDLFRGLALLAVFVDHFEFGAGVAVVSRWTLHQWYWCDAAEVFVLCSGLVCGWSYLSKLDRAGFAACQRKGLKRAAQLYLVNLTCLFAIVLLVITCGSPDSRAFNRLQYHGLQYGLPQVTLASIALLYQPLGTDILTLYIQFVTLLPLLLAFWRRWPLLTKIACFEAYLLAQWLVWLNLPRWPFNDFPGISGRYFHHIAWNALFFLGAFVAIDPIRGCGRVVRRLVYVVCLGTVVVIVASTMPGWRAWLPFLEPLNALRSSEWCSKQTLGPLRLVAFLALGYVVSTTVSNSWCQQWERPLGPLLLIGRNSLLVFSFGLVLSHTSWLLASVVSAARLPAAVLVYETCCLLLIFSAAWAWEHHWGRRRITSTEASTNVCVR